MPRKRRLLPPPPAAAEETPTAAEDADCRRGDAEETPGGCRGDSFSDTELRHAEETQSLDTELRHRA
jgi:hypothetical protein